VIQKRLALVKESADTLRNLLINIAQNQKHTEVRADKKININIMKQTQLLKTSLINPNPNNPRIVKDYKYKALVKSIKEFPDMLNLRPIVVNKDMVVLGGNMRLRACKEAGLKEVPVIIADQLTEKEQREFTIKDNQGSGEWDWDMIANDWDIAELEDWDLKIPNMNVEDEIITSESMNNKDLGDMLNNYNNATIKQIVLYYDLEEFEYVLRKLDEIGKENKLDDNSTVIRYLVDEYFKKQK
jgi:hypothetical protein